MSSSETSVTYERTSSFAFTKSTASIFASNAAITFAGVETSAPVSLSFARARTPSCRTASFEQPLCGLEEVRLVSAGRICGEYRRIIVLKRVENGASESGSSQFSSKSCTDNLFFSNQLRIDYQKLPSRVNRDREARPPLSNHLKTETKKTGPQMRACGEDDFLPLTTPRSRRPGGVAPWQGLHRGVRAERCPSAPTTPPLRPRPAPSPCTGR